MNDRALRSWQVAGLVALALIVVTIPVSQWRRDDREAAVTSEGSAPTFVCRKFSRISKREGAMILIHEALHHAGMGEWPKDPKALTSQAINQLVEEACGL